MAGEVVADESEVEHSSAFMYVSTDALLFKFLEFNFEEQSISLSS